MYLVDVDLGFESENALVDYVNTDPNIFGAIVFIGSEYFSSLPKTIVYKIRLRSDKEEWNTAAMFYDLITTTLRVGFDLYGGKDPGILIYTSSNYYRNLYLVIC